jgi:hypothetical protein
MPERSPGEQAYEAFARVQQATGGDWRLPTPFARLQTLTQHAWDAAAQAVREDTPRFQFALGQHVRRTSDPAQVWEIWWRSCREEIGRTCIDYGFRLVDTHADFNPCRMSDGSDLTPAEDEA